LPKKGTTKTRTRTVTKRIKSYMSRKPHTGGAISGAVAGLVGVLASKMLGTWSQPASDLGVGYFMKSQKTIMERLQKVKELTVMAQHDQVSKGQIKIFKARIETLNWVLENE